jgi:hypothetical protein
VFRCEAQDQESAPAVCPISVDVCTLLALRSGIFSLGRFGAHYTARDGQHDFDFNIEVWHAHEAHS